MGVLDVLKEFAGVKPDTAVQASGNPPNPGNPNSQANSQTTNTTVPSAATPKSDGSIAAIPAAGEGEKSPLAEFEKLWEAPDPTKTPKSPDALAIQFEADPVKMMEAAKRVDFTKIIPPPLMERMQKGESAALLEGMNLVAQATYAQSASATTNILKVALQRQADVFKKEVMPEMFRQNLTQQTLRAENPIFDNAAVTPLVSMVEKQLLAKNPAATAAEITNMAKEYLSGFATEFLSSSGKVISDKPAQTRATGSREPEDWASFFGV